MMRAPSRSSHSCCGSVERGRAHQPGTRGGPARPDRPVAHAPIVSRILASMTIASRLPALALLVLVVVAAALLVAGWGVAVGVGVFIGLVLGFVAILAAMAIAQRSGGSVSFASLRAASNPTDPDQAPHDEHRR